MADVALPNGTSWAEAGEKFIVESGRAMRVVAAAAAAPEAPIVLRGSRRDGRLKTNGPGHAGVR